MNIKTKKNEKPEELVRSFIIKYLIENYNFKEDLFRVERKIYGEINNKIRPDAVVYDLKGEPFMIIECKAKNVEITEDVVYQIIKYNKILKSKYLLITNGFKIYCWKLIEGSYIKSEIPYFD